MPLAPKCCSEAGHSDHLARLECRYGLKPFSGTLVFYGALIGDVPSIAMNEIPRSTRITYGVANDHIRTPEEMGARTSELFRLVEQGDLTVYIGKLYPLTEAEQAHRDIESRATTGKLLLIP